MDLSKVAFTPLQPGGERSTHRRASRLTGGVTKILSSPNTRIAAEPDHMYQHIKVPEGGQKITVNTDFSLNVPNNPIIPYIEGDGTGFDITPVMIKVVDAAGGKGYSGKKNNHWKESKES